MVSLLEIADEIHLEDPKLFPIWDAVQEERRLTLEQGVTILDSEANQLRALADLSVLVGG